MAYILVTGVWSERCMKWVKMTSLQANEKGERESKNRYPSLFMTWSPLGHLRKIAHKSISGYKYARPMEIEHGVATYQKKYTENCRHYWPIWSERCMKWGKRSRTSLQANEKGERESKNSHPSLFMTWSLVGHLRKVRLHKHIRL